MLATLNILRSTEGTALEQDNTQIQEGPVRGQETQIFYGGGGLTKGFQRKFYHPTPAMRPQYCLSKARQTITLM